MPDWLATLFFTPELERHILEEHGYSDELEVRLMRTKEDLQLIDFVELQLKSKDGFSKADEVALSWSGSIFTKVNSDSTRRLAMPILL